MSLRGRNAVVTGGASGVGRAVADRLVADGARVMVWDRPEALADAGEHEATAVDVTDHAAVDAAAARAVSLFGAIDILVNSAGVTCPPMSIGEYEIAAWRQVIDVNLSGVFYCCRAVLPGMVARGRGRVVNIASMAGKEGNPRETAYSAAKAGVIGLTKSLGREVARRGAVFPVRLVHRRRHPAHGVAAAGRRHGGCRRADGR